MEVSNEAAGEVQVAEDDVLDAFAKERLAPRRHLLGALTSQCQRERDVVGREAPEGVLVGADFAEVESIRIEVQHTPERAALGELVEALEDGVEAQQVANHQHAILGGGGGNEFAGIGDGEGERLLD